MSSLADYYICPFCQYIYGDVHSSEECIKFRKKDKSLKKDIQTVSDYQLNFKKQYTVNVKINKT